MNSDSLKKQYSTVRYPYPVQFMYSAMWYVAANHLALVCFCLVLTAATQKTHRYILNMVVFWTISSKIAFLPDS